jgi:hypothetical protein
MHPLTILGTLAAGAVVVAKVKGKSPEPPAVHPEIAKAARGLALGHMRRGATPEQAAARAAEQIATQGGGFWKDKPIPEDSRF